MSVILNQKINELLEKQCYVIDYLPKRVPTDAKGQYFEVENYLLNNFKRHRIYDRFVNVIFKLMCYYPVVILWNGWQEQPAPDTIALAIEEMMENHSGTLEVLFPEDDALLIVEWDCLHLSVYHPNEEMQKCMKEIAWSEGLFWRKAGDE